MRNALKWIPLFLVLGLGVLENREASGQEVGSANGPYLLLDKGLQYRITKSINSMYNFDFATAERDFTVILYQYPEHPLPDFLMALSYWWRIEIDVENTRFDRIFIQYLDRANAKAKKMLDQKDD